MTSISPDDVQQSITAFWSTVATSYEAHPGNTVPVGSAAYRAWEALFARLLPDAPSDVLDVCTGTGFAAILASSLGHRVVGIDLSDKMLRVARTMAKRRGLRIRFAKRDGVATKFAEASFDVVLSRHALWTLRNALDAIRHWHSILREDGRVIVIDAFHEWAAPDSTSEQDQFFNRYYTADVQTALQFMRARNETPLLEAFRDAGYRDVSFEELSNEYGDDDYRPYVLAARR
jgi:ubiquinone/menaquinone biosynthesis C-methylase UbiE